MKLTVNQYAANEGISVQSVYARIKRGTLNSIEENGIKYVLLEDTSVKRKSADPLKQAFKIIKRQDKQIKDLHKEIKRLTRKNEEQNKFLIGKYENALPAPKQDDVVDVKIKPKKKDKKKRKKGKK